MATRTSFTADEWHKVTQAPLMAGLGITALDFGLVSFAKEMAAVIREVKAAREQYPNNELIQAVTTELETRTKEPAPASDEKKTPDQILAELASVGTLVDAKATADEAREFKTFVFGVGEKAANASGSGFLGFGAKVSDAERAYLDRLRANLGL